MLLSPFFPHLRKNALSVWSAVAITGPVAFLNPVLVFADDQLQSLPSVKVSADGIEETATGPVEGYVAKQSATATKTDTPLIEVAQAITIVSAEQIRDQGAPNLQEALRYTAGVRHELYGIDNRGDWMALRGSDESTQLLDGMRLPLTGWYGVVRIEPFNYERIEVLRGPSSIIAGANDPGGVINLVTKRPLEETRREIGVRAGSNQLREIHTDLTGPLTSDGDLLYRLVAVGKESDTQIDYADEKRLLFSPSITWNASDDFSLTAYGEYQYDRSKNTNAFLGLEGTLEPAANGPVPRDLFIGEPEWDRYGGTRNRFGYSLEYQLNQTWELRHQLRHDDVDGLMRSMYANWWEGFVNENGSADANGQYLNRTWYVYDDAAQITTSELLFEGKFNVGPVQHTLLIGVDGMNHNGRQFSSEGEGTALNVYAPVYGTFPDPVSAEISTERSKIDRAGLLLQDQIKMTEELSLRLGVRRDQIHNEKSIGATSLNFGLVYQVSPGLAPYFSYSESFNPVAGLDGARNPYKPKRGEQFEGGLKWQPEDMPLQTTLAFYSLREKNRLAPGATASDPSTQIGKAKIKGAELEASANFDAWRFIGSFTYTKARADATSWGGELNPDEQLEGVPERSTSLWAIRDFADLGLYGFSFGGGARYVGKIGDGTGNHFLPTVTLYDAMAAYETGQWRIAVNANNLTDKDYIATCLARGDCWFGQRRTITSTLTYLW